MPVRNNNVYYRVKTYASGKKVRLAISTDGRILEATPVVSKVKRTKTGKRLARRRRRIG
jgi:hypothetical protein